jgi:hypothetical protein
MRSGYSEVIFPSSTRLRKCSNELLTRTDWAAAQQGVGVPTESNLLEDAGNSEALFPAHEMT